MTTFRPMGVSLMIAAALALLAVAAPAPNAQQRGALIPGFLITERTDESIAGRFTHGAYVGDFEARREGPSLASAQVRVGLPAGVNGPGREAERELVLDASARLSEGGKKSAVTIDGHGRALTLGLKRALTDFSKRLEQRLAPYGQELPPQEDLLVRSSLYWAEAPVGLKLKRREVRPPAR